MKTDLFDFRLRQDAVALRPCSPRDGARLLVVTPHGDTPQGKNADAPDVTDRFIKDLPKLLKPGDVLVFNDTRVIPAALKGVRLRGDARARISCNLIKRVDQCSWQALAKPLKKLQPGDLIRFGNVNLSGTTEELTAHVKQQEEACSITLKFNFDGSNLDKAIQSVGEMPLPPYIAGKREPDTDDRQNYQTVYASIEGAVAAPTAGLHFTNELLKALDDRGIERHTLTLHVGAGTFLPVKVEDTKDHQMHAEWGKISSATVDAINEARSQGRRIIAVGTTALRLLESAAQDEDGTLKPFEGETSIFICPGYRFKIADALLTNFHLPRSTLFMLVSAFTGLDAMKHAYNHAIENGYRFYSYGDANLLFRK